MSPSVPLEIKTVGILSNPLSGRIGNDASVIRDIALTIPGEIYREASKPAEFEAVLNEFAGSQLDLLVIIAGDGTVHGILSYIFNNRIFSPLPMMFIVPAGTTNMTAKDFNASGKPKKLLSRLAFTLANPGPYAYITRPVLCIRNGNDTPQYGMFFGAGIIAEGVKYFHKRVRGLGITGERASGIVLLRYLFCLLTGSGTGDSGNLKIHIQHDSDGGSDEDCLLIFATCLDRLLLGLRPYWGEQQQPIHVTRLRQSPRRLWRAIFPLLSGGGSGLAEADGYNSYNLSTLSLKMTGDFIIDGEIYSADEKKGTVNISVEDTISVIDLSN